MADFRYPYISTDYQLMVILTPSPLYKHLKWTLSPLNLDVSICLKRGVWQITQTEFTEVLIRTT